MSSAAAPSALTLRPAINYKPKRRRFGMNSMHPVALPYAPPLGPSSPYPRMRLSRIAADRIPGCRWEACLIHRPLEWLVVRLNASPSGLPED